MHQTLKHCLYALIGIGMPIQLHAAYFFGYPIYPYIGADYQYRDTPLHSGQGDNIFDSQFQQGQIYVGVRFLQYFGLEFGYGKTNIKNQYTQFDANNVALGVLIPPGGPLETHLSQAEYKTYTANVMGFYLLPFDKRCRTELIGSFGIARIQPKLISELTHLDLMPLAVPMTFTFDQRKTVLRLMGGIQYKITPNMGMRASITFEDTSQFRDIKASEWQNTNRFIALKNTWLYGLGIYFNTSEG